MIKLNSIENPSLHVAARAKSMWATRYDQGEHTVIYKVTPWGRKFDHKVKDRRLVLFDLKRGVAECLSLETGEQCPANAYGLLCAHIYAASKRLEAAAKRAA